MEDVPLFTSTESTHKACKVAASVIFQVLDHHSRRPEHQDRVIGTLVGYDHDGVIEVRNSFPVLHTEDDQVGVDMAFHKTMLGLHRKVAPKEVVVGWYSSGPVINEASVMIQDFYGREMNGNPIHMTVDTTLANDTMAIKAWSHTSITLNDKTLGSHFLPVPLEIQTNDQEKIGLDAIKLRKGGVVGSGVHSLVGELESLQSSVRKLVELIDTVADYVKKVVDGTIPGDNNVGRLLCASLAVLPKLDAGSLERIVQNNVQDLLLLVYLSNLTKTQLQIAEKLTKAI
eukprot:TRINITY_DN23115_c0_g1_i1.p1 TRINITY_DN23115_c0_g1~~TRINITY_DN23115_c0_g1_i1.p1  ORF type:complete len:286 (+),score=83.91 TRINITY_DN23115_c0_g1_i1:37-894(+)